MTQAEAGIKDHTLKDETILKTTSFKASLISKITLADSTVIEYFNGKPISITRPDNTGISDILLESYSASETDYDREEGSDQLIRFHEAAGDVIKISFTAVTAGGDTYIFKDNVLVRIVRRGISGHYCM